MSVEGISRSEGVPAPQSTTGKIATEKMLANWQTLTPKQFSEGGFQQGLMFFLPGFQQTFPNLSFGNLNIDVNNNDFTAFQDDLATIQSNLANTSLSDSDFNTAMYQSLVGVARGLPNVGGDPTQFNQTREFLLGTISNMSLDTYLPSTCSDGLKALVSDLGKPMSQPDQSWAEYMGSEISTFAGYFT